MASLRARHSRKCGPFKGSDSTFDDARGCGCPAMYYVVVREGTRAKWEPVGRNRKVAERALTKVQAQEDEGSWVAPRNVTFGVFADRWLAGLELKETTKHSYSGTVRLAKVTLGDKTVRRINAEDIKQFTARMRDRGVSDSTRARHLRVLGVCFESAVADSYAAVNPVRRLRPGERPKRREGKEAAYFENAELPALIGNVDDELMRTLFITALQTGMRQGELLAACWGDVDLSGAVIHVRRSITNGHLSTPKNRKRREVDLVPDTVELLGQHWGELGRPADDLLVFPGNTRTGYINPQTILRRVLYPAMELAEIPRVGPTGEQRNFHSFRHTFSKRALENGASITWLSRHLGHSSVNVTTEVYGHFEKAERKRQLERLTNAFSV